MLLKRKMRDEDGVRDVIKGNYTPWLIHVDDGIATQSLKNHARA